jgi:hypothetical protein
LQFPYGPFYRKVQWHDEIMPFHVDRHKAKATKRFAFAFGPRLLVATFGGLLIFGGLFRLSHGVLFGLNRYYLPVFSGGQITLGVVVVLAAMIPSSWIEKTAAWLASGHR